MELELQVFNTEVMLFLANIYFDYSFASLFVFQLGSLCEIKSISKAKMSQVTKSAIKAIKMYKHVVQSVEKFIAKVCSE